MYFLHWIILTFLVDVFVLFNSLGSVIFIFFVLHLFIREHRQKVGKNVRVRRVYNDYLSAESSLKRDHILVGLPWLLDQPSVAVQSHLGIFGYAAPSGACCAVHHPTLDLARPDLEVGLDVRHHHDRLAVSAPREGRPRALPAVVVLIIRCRLGGMGLPDEAFCAASRPSLLETGERGPGLLLAFVQEREPGHRLDEVFGGVHFRYLLGGGRKELIDRLVGDVMYDIVLGMAAVEDAARYAIVEDGEL